jgi:hypothetical protein
VGGLGMIASDEFSRYYAELLQGTYDCVDRVVLNAFYPLGQTGGGVRSWWRRLYGDDSNLDDEHLREMAGTFSRRLHAFCAKQGISNLLFWRGTTMDEVYQKLIDRTRAPLDLKQVKTIFGFSHRPHHTAKRGRERTEVFKAVQAASYDLTVFKIKWGNLTLKIYDKGGRVLRIEVVVHNAKELRCGMLATGAISRRKSKLSLS